MRANAAKVYDDVVEELSRYRGASIQPDQKLSDLGINSLDILDILVSLENQFDVAIAQELELDITVKQLADRIMELLNGR